MTDKDKALSLEQTLRLALEALENSVDLVREDAYNAEQLYGNYPARQGKVRGLKVLADDHEKAITAIKAALLSRSDGEAQTRSVDKDEPMAWRDAAIRLGEELSSVGPDGYYDMDAKEWLDWAMEQNPRGEHSLPKRKPLTIEQPKVRTGDCLLVGVCASEGHKIQPQRTWVGLTEAECGVLWKVGMTPFDYYQAIEAKLKEKNGYA